jgi:hypothetical protein
MNCLYLIQSFRRLEFHLLAESIFIHHITKRVLRSLLPISIERHRHSQRHHLSSIFILVPSLNGFPNYRSYG